MSEELEGASTIESGQLFKWDTPGKTISGVYYNYEERPDTGKGPGHVYEVLTKDGVIPFFAPSLLHKKLQDVAKGNIVVITYKEESKTKVGNTLKVFEVKSAPDTNNNRVKIGLPEKIAEEETTE